ncbi:DUF4260 family protein [Nocardia sp. CDC160]|uniref:DUF4260 family protein n=1 Tax=Nocardia sp. CDC160 TaxID=3112166 RepID=UPI002DC03205|nr:DUF4260 family protein [Nocardia sp. CDC160]MEC3913468.1 DUF4260 family protein [Nocardia sp. CDC160]
MTAIPATLSTTTDHRLPTTVRKAGWIAWALFLAAFAILEGVNHGTGSWLALVAGLIAPDLTFFAAIGAKDPVRQGQLPRQAVPFYNAAHRTWIPLALTLAYALAGPQLPALFTFLLAWMLHIAIDRAAGYGLRTADGFIRA